MAEDGGGDPAARLVPPRRPHSSGDGWVHDAAGNRYWGLYGAAGLLLFRPDAGVLLQHRAFWSHFGGTWGIPGGARHEGESAQSAATREAGEEAGVPGSLVEYRFCSVLDLGFWSYTTVAAVATGPFTAVISDPESLELRWVPVDEVGALDLHPGFAASWPLLRPHLIDRLTVVVDAANVVGSRPDGWWRDRAGATRRLASRLRRWARNGVDGPDLGLAHDVWFPRVELVVEGEARGASVPDDPVLAVFEAQHDGDTAIVDRVAAIIGDHMSKAPVLVVTADRELIRRVQVLGAAVLPPGWLLDRLDADDAPEKRGR